MHYIDRTHGYGVPWMKHSLKLILQTYGLKILVKTFTIWHLLGDFIPKNNMLDD